MVLVAGPGDYRDSQGRAVAAPDMDLQARLIFYNKCHESMAGTGSMCIAAMSAIEGTLVHEAAAGRGPDTLRIGHPLGVMEVVAQAAPGQDAAGIQFERLGFRRTARRLMQGTAYVSRDGL